MNFATIAENSELDDVSMKTVRVDLMQRDL